MSGPHTHTIMPQTTTMVAGASWISPRLRLKPQGHTGGWVDGAWWPRSRDLPAELPELAAGLGRLERVSYNISIWDVALPRRAAVDGHRVRLEGFHSQHRHTVDVITTDQARLTLLVVPPESTPAAAQQLLATASRRDNADSIDELIPDGDCTPARREPVQEATAAAAGQQWTLNGGRLYEPVSALHSRTAVQRSMPREHQPLQRPSRTAASSPTGRNS